ncbi:hypothetical protein [Aporhodopirellula aestuarii]|uniref:Autotransporter domain-containing protein n=1 Tax=Aporhodopirellula aestuarii TaxID=2950107 RepID=A0ABT0TZA3_9BACT|nr:hypothetical protein [Aporhodopirellula aestuarii]MCM2369890.1 hypothetical protein [Aporhodopirellula aestuarii]
MPRATHAFLAIFACLLPGLAFAQAPPSPAPLSFMDDSTSTLDLNTASRNQPNPPSTNPNRTSDRRSRLARMPKMYGDMLIIGKAYIDDSSFGVDGKTTFPVPGLAKVAENNSPVPQDRIFFIQNHYHNAVQTHQDIISAGEVYAEGNVDRSTLGIEKTFFNKWASLELRLPFLTTGDLTTDSPIAPSNAEFDGVGLTLKSLLYESHNCAVSCGVGSMIPVGDETRFSTSLGSYVLDHETFHLSPFLAGSRTFGDTFFGQGFIQIDFPIDDDDVTATVSGTTYDAGDVAPPTLLHLDGSVGAWLYRNERSRFLTGFASLLELHYTRSISDVETVSFEDPLPITIADFTLGTPGEIELFNLTAGLHFEIRRSTTFRVAAVAPLFDGTRRAFDTEVQFSLNRHF